MAAYRSVALDGVLHGAIKSRCSHEALAKLSIGIEGLGFRVSG